METAAYQQSTQPVPICVPELVWEDWQQEVAERAVSTMFAAGLLRWLQLTPAKRVVRMNHWVRRLPQAAWRRDNCAWRTLRLPPSLTDAATRTQQQECARQWQPAWWAASMLEIAYDETDYMAADGSGPVDAWAYALEQLLNWQQTHAFVTAMQAAGFKMAGFDPFAEVPGEGMALARVRRRRR